MLKIEPKVAFGMISGLAAGGLIAGTICARYTLLNPAHAALFSLATIVATFVLHKGLQWYYQEQYKNLPLGFKLVSNMSMATLITGAIAGDYFGVNLAISVALKIMAGSLITGALGWFIGKNLSKPAFIPPVVTPGEPSAPLKSSI